MASRMRSELPTAEENAAQVSEERSCFLLPDVERENRGWGRSHHAGHCSNAPGPFH
jgi:hypothetical protein